MTAPVPAAPDGTDQRVAEVRAWVQDARSIPDGELITAGHPSLVGSVMTLLEAYEALRVRASWRLTRTYDSMAAEIAELTADRDHWVKAAVRHAEERDDASPAVPDEAVREQLAGSGHILRVTAAHDTVTIGVVCLEPVGATCRRWCTKPGCDREEGIPHFDYNHDGLSPEETEHPTGDVGYCLTAEWINESGPAGECHDPTAGPEAIADGLPVTTEWDGDGYVWRVAEAGWVLAPGQHGIGRGIGLIAKERWRQVIVEEYYSNHDARHVNGELVQAAIYYADVTAPVMEWPWGEPPKPKGDDRIRDLAKAGALIAAEIDRLSSRPAPESTQDGAR